MAQGQVSTLGRIRSDKPIKLEGPPSLRRNIGYDNLRRCLDLHIPGMTESRGWKPIAWMRCMINISRMMPCGGRCN